MEEGHKREQSGTGPSRKKGGSLILMGKQEEWGQVGCGIDDVEFLPGSFCEEESKAICFWRERKDMMESLIRGK